MMNHNIPAFFFKPSVAAAGLLFILCFMLLGNLICPDAFASAPPSGESGAEDSQRVIFNIAVCVVAASVMGLIIKLARQPLILGHILAGVIIGPIGFGIIKEHHEIITISEIGLILLLFMIGMDIDLHKMLKSGKKILIPGLFQFPLCLMSSYLFLVLLEAVGMSLAEGAFSRIYIAAAISLSSTMIVVKLLYEKFELDTVPGRITLGILVFQDIWAIILLALQPSLSNPNVAGLAGTFLLGGALIAGSLLISKYLLPHIFRSAAKVPELMLLISLGWCFLVSLVAAHPVVGLSMEMGALIAGVSLATFPYNIDVNAKVLSLRDFFVTLFFIALGMQIPIPNMGMLFAALCVVVIALVVKVIGIFGILSLLKAGHRNAILPTLNLSQISEFSLVILSLGIVYEHISPDTLSLIIWVFSILAIASTYFIVYNHQLQGGIVRLLKSVGWDDLAFADETETEHHDHYIVILGFHRIASAFLHDIQRMRPELLAKIKVIDFNPSVKQALDKMSVKCVYGDISHLNTLLHADISEAQIVLSTVPDSILRGTSNLKIVNTIRSLCPRAKIFLTSGKPDEAVTFYESGADYVIQPTKIAGTALYYAVESALRGDIEALREQEVNLTAERHEVLL